MINNHIRDKYTTSVIAGLGAGFCILILLFLYYQNYTFVSPIFSQGMLFLFAGMIVEGLRLSKKWQVVSIIFVLAIAFTLFTFLVIQNKSVYNLNILIELIPYIFIFYFTFIFAVFYKEKVTAQLSEGVTLLQTLAILYWIIDSDLALYQNWWVYSVSATVCLFSIFVSVNALTQLHLSETIRIILSMWSSLIMMVFAADHIFYVFNQTVSEASFDTAQLISKGVPYFLLGVSSLYIMQNYLLLIAFIPGKKDKYVTDSERVAASEREFRQSKEDHLSRYSTYQISFFEAIFCICYAFLVFGSNYYLDLLSKQSAIWLVFFTFPILLSGFKKIKLI